MSACDREKKKKRREQFSRGYVFTHKTASIDTGHAVRETGGAATGLAADLLSTVHRFRVRVLKGQWNTFTRKGIGS